MPLNRYVVRVDPQGQTVVVDVLDTSGASVIAYESSQFGAATLTLPLTITAQTDFWLHDPGAYDISCKVGGAEVADAGAPKRVQVSDVPVLVVPDWERERTASPGGSTPAGVSIVRAFPFAFDTPNLVTGHTVYTPTIGDVLLEAWVEVDTAWDGTTPLFDFGSLVGVDGLFATFAGFSNPEMSSADTASGTGGSLLQATGAHNATLSETADQSGGNTLSRVLPMKFMTADPLKVVVSDNGLKTGGDPGATHGAATLYLITATPAT